AGGVSRRASTSRPPIPISTTTQGSTPTRATCRPACSWSTQSSIGRSRPVARGWTSCVATRATSTSGARRTNRSSGFSCGGGTADVSAPGPRDPCLEPVPHPRLPGGRIRVVEVLATGSNGGAQEHLFSLVTRIDPTRYDVSVVSLSAGSAVRKLQRAGVSVLVIDEPDDAIAVGALAAHLAEVRPDVVHAHMYRAETVAARAVLALGGAGQR